MSVATERPSPRRTAAVGGTAVVVLVVVDLAVAAFRSREDDAGDQVQVGDVTVSDDWMSVSLDLGAGYLTFDNAG